MTNYAERLRKYNRASQVQYEWFEEVADYIEKLELEVEALDYGLTAAYTSGYHDGKKAMMNKQEDYSSQNVGLLGVETIEEREDGSATCKFYMDESARDLVVQEGLKLLMYCAAAKLDMGVVYDFIESHMENNNE